jgi:hypothetical protein
MPKDHITAPMKYNKRPLVNRGVRKIYEDEAGNCLWMDADKRLAVRNAEGKIINARDTQSFLRRPAVRQALAKYYASKGEGDSEHVVHGMAPGTKSKRVYETRIKPTSPWGIPPMGEIPPTYGLEVSLRAKSGEMPDIKLPDGLGFVPKGKKKEPWGLAW